jgi:hypothetical protein
MANEKKKIRTQANNGARFRNSLAFIQEQMRRGSGRSGKLLRVNVDWQIFG